MFLQEEISMKNLYIDFDGVILDTITYLYRDFKETCKNYAEEEIKNFYVNYHWENIIKDDFIINDSINCIKKIIASNKFNLAILTHVNSINEAVLKINYLRKYQVNQSVIDNAKDDCIFLHCLPSFHDQNTTIGKEIYEKFGVPEMEVTDEVFNGSHSRVFEEAENRMHTIKAVIYATLRN